MNHLKNVLILLLFGTPLIFTSCSEKSKRLLVFTLTKGYHHESIDVGKEAIMKLAARNGISVDTTTDASYFNEDSLKHYSAVIFFNTTGNVLNHIQQADFERYIQAGGGFVGIHSATDTEYEWPWYGKLVGGYFSGHPGDPNVRDGVATVAVETSHPAIIGLPETWKRTDEYYDFKNFNEDVNVLITIDQTTYDYGDNTSHPMSWYHDYDGGRSFYTNFGHTKESFSDKEYLDHLWGGISYAIGDNDLNYQRAKSKRVPEENRFAQEIFADNLNEPMELAIVDHKKVLFIERKGDLKLYDQNIDSVKTIAHIPVHTTHEDGLLGLALDPSFKENRWIYLFYSPVGDEPVQHVSRFTLFENDSLGFESEKLILKIPVQRKECCHAAGALAFGPDGNLFISIGDNTNPFNIEGRSFNSLGYAPMNEQEGYEPWDAQRSSGNMADLRGAILRISPTKEGSYEIPEGNLFPADGSAGRPEIYVKGCRNPFRFSIDPKTKYVYWGDVGPDAREPDPKRGPQGHDEVNQAKGPGYFGWPFFVGNNKPYRDFNYQTGDHAESFFEPTQVVNRSPNNTGPRQLPPAQPAMIWYPYSNSKEFPQVGDGGRNAMAGPVFYSDLHKGENALPAYYDGKLIIYDWIRGWLKVVTFDENGNYEKMEPFLTNMDFVNPVDIELAEDGSLYVLEYGRNWFSRNKEARLSRIDFAAGNREPVAQLKADKVVGAAPMEVHFSAAQSFDYDPDEELSYSWYFEGEEKQSDELNPSFIFESVGTYHPKLVVTDASGATSTAEIEIQVGNDPPQIDIALTSNKSFYWDAKDIAYEISAKDTEDGPIADGVEVYFDYLPLGEDLTMIAQGHQQASVLAIGKSLIDNSDCKACHQTNQYSVGPSYMMVAERYDDSDQMIKTIASKIINGGGGNWGERMMAAHPNFTQDEAEAIATYILTIDQVPEKEMLEMAGQIKTDQHTKDGSSGMYILTAKYTDKGGNQIAPLTTKKEIRLLPAKLQVENSDFNKGVRKFTRNGGKLSFYGELGNKSWFGFNAIDFAGISSVTVRIRVPSEGTNTIVFRSGVEGEIIAEAVVPMSEGVDWQEVDIPITQVPSELVDLYIMFEYEGEENNANMAMDWLLFNQDEKMISMR